MVDEACGHTHTPSSLLCPHALLCALRALLGPPLPPPPSLPPNKVLHLADGVLLSLAERPMLQIGTLSVFIVSALKNTVGEGQRGACAQGMTSVHDQCLHEENKVMTRSPPG